MNIWFIRRSAALCAAGRASRHILRGAARGIALTAAVVTALQPLTMGFAQAQAAQPLVQQFAQVIPDANAPIQFRPGVSASRSGAPVVDIVAPSPGGLSHNKFREYNVDARGLILNNSGLGGVSITGGAVAANPNLTGRRSAGIILNEVTGSSRSLLNGVTEVFGGRADVIIANPNGIGCASCRFVNAGRITLSSGAPTPDYQSGAVSFGVRRGTISIEGSGVSGPDGGPLAAIDLIGRQLQINAPVVAHGKARLRAGAMIWDQARDRMASLNAADGGDTPAINGPAIASSTGGVIRAGAISALSQDVDLGIVLAGDLSTLDAPSGRSGDIAVRGAGDVSVVSAGATGDLLFDAAGHLTLSGGAGFAQGADPHRAASHTSLGRITLQGRHVTVEPAANVQAGDAIMVEALEQLAASGVLGAGQSISLVTSGDIVATGKILANGHLAIEGRSVTANNLAASGEQVFVTGAGNGAVSLDGVVLGSRSAITLSGGDVRLGEGTAFEAPGAIRIDARGDLTNGARLNYGNLELTIAGGLRNQSTGELVQDHLLLNLAGDLVNAGMLKGNIGAVINAASLTNETSGVIFGEQLEVNVAGDVRNLGKMLSARAMTVASAGAVRNDGTISALDSITLRATRYEAGSPGAMLEAASARLMVAGGFDNAGRVLGRDLLELSADSYRGGAGATLLSARADLRVTGAFDNNGSVLGISRLDLAAASYRGGATSALESADARLTVAGVFENDGHVLGEDGLELAAASYRAGSGAALRSAQARLTLTGSFDNDGQMLGRDLLVLSAASLRNGATATIIAQKAARLALTGDLDNRGVISAVDDLNLSAVMARNGGVIASENGLLHLTGAGYDGIGEDARLNGARIRIDLGDGAFSNAGRLATPGPLELNAGAFSQDASAVFQGGGVTLNLTGDVRNAGAVEALERLKLHARAVANHGRLVATQSVEIAGTSLNNASATSSIVGAGVDLVISGGLINRGAIESTGGLNVTATGLDNGGRLLANAGGVLNISGDFANSGAARFGGDLQANVAGGYAGAAGSILDAGRLMLVAGADVRNAGEFKAGLLKVSAIGLDNQAGARMDGKVIDLALRADAANAGTIIAGDLQANVAGGYSGAAGSVLSATQVVLAAGADVRNAGNIAAQDQLRLSANALDNQAGARMDGKVIDLALRAGAANAGTVAASDFLAVDASGALSNGGAIAGQDIALRIGGQISNHGRIAAAGVLALNGQGLGNHRGASITADRASLTLREDVGNAGVIRADALVLSAANLGNAGADGAIASVSGGELTIDVRKSISNDAYAGIHGERKLVLRGERSNINLLNASDTTSGGVSWGGDLGVELRGEGLVVGEGQTLATPNGKLTLAYGGDVRVLGTIAAGDDLTLTAGGSILVGEARQQWEPGRRGEPGRRLVETKVTSGQIFTRGNGSITAAGDLINTASTIEASGALGLHIGGTLTNTRTEQLVTPAGWRNPSIHIGVRRPGKYTDFLTRYSETSGAGQIIAGEDLSIKANALNNDASTVQAGGVLALETGELSNRSRETGLHYRTFKTGGDTNVGVPQREGWEADHTETTGYLGGGAGVNARVAMRFDNTGAIEGPRVDVAARVVVNGITDPTITTPHPRIPDPVIDIGNYIPGVHVQGVEINPGKPSVFRGDLPAVRGLPQIAGFERPNPATVNGVHFLYAAPVADARERGPGWILGQVGDMRAGPTFIADATMERRLIQQALIDQIGRGLLDPRLGSAKKQQEALYQGTVEFLRANPDIRLGQELSAAQKARVTQPVLWYQERMVGGVKALVPQLLLPQDRLAEWTKNAGGQILAGDIFLSASQVTNTGGLLATGDLLIDAGSFINERRVAANGTGPHTVNQLQTGGLVSGADILIQTRDDLTSRGGAITGASSVAMRAGGDITITAQSVINEMISGGKTSVHADSKIHHAAQVASGGDLVLVAGGALGVLGADLFAAGNARLHAGDGIHIASAVDVVNVSTSTRKGNLFNKSTTATADHRQTNIAAVVTAGGDLTLTTGGDMGVTASHLAAGGGLVAAAGGDIRVQSGADIHNETRVTKSSGVFVPGGGGNFDLYNRKTIITSSHTSTNAPSSLVAGGDVVVDAGRDVNVRGSLLSAGKHASVAAGRDVSISAAREEEAHFYSRKETGFGFGGRAKDGSASASAGWRRKSDVIATEATSAAPSLVQGGAGVGIAASRDVMISASDIMSGGDVHVAAGNNLSLLAQTDIARSMQSHKESFVGVRGTVSENVSNAVKQLRQVPKTARSGHGGAGYKAIAKASAAMQAIDGALQLVNPTVSASVTVGASRSKSSSQTWQETARPVTITAGGDIALSSGADMHLQASQLRAGNDLLLDAGRNLLIESAQPRYGSEQSASSASAFFGAGASAGFTGVTYGVTASGSYARSHGELQGMANVNALLEAGNTLVIRSGNDTTIAGATVGAPDVLLDVGGNLSIASRQDTERSSSDAFNIAGSIMAGANGNISGTFNLGGGYSKSDKAWVNNQTAIIADNRLDIRTGGHTQIDGAVVASGAGDLRLDTGTLAVTDIQDFDRAESFNGQIGVNYNFGGEGGKDTGKGEGKGAEASGDNAGATKPGAVNAQGKLTGGNLSGKYESSDREQFTRGTIGAGDIIIRDEANQRQDVASINRDLAKAQEITKDESAGTEFYASDTAIKEIVTGFEGTRSGASRIAGDAAQGFPQFRANVEDAARGMELAGKSLVQAFDQIGQRLVDRGQLTQRQLDSARRIASSIEAGDTDIRALLNCSRSQSGFNLFSVFVTPARASDCAILSKATGTLIASLTAQERIVCIELLSGMAQEYLRAQLDGRKAGPLPGWVAALAGQIRSIDRDYPDARNLLSAFGEAGNYLREISIYAIGGEEAVQTYRNIKKFGAEAGSISKAALDDAIGKITLEKGLSPKDQADLKLLAQTGVFVAVAAAGVKVAKGALKGEVKADAGAGKGAGTPYRFLEAGQGTNLRRTVQINGETIQLNSGHGYSRQHKSGDVRASGVSMDAIDTAIVNDILASIKSAAPPTVPLKASRTISVGDYRVTYDVLRLQNGNISVSTYYPGK